MTGDGPMRYRWLGGVMRLKTIDLHPYPAPQDEPSLMDVLWDRSEQLGVHVFLRTYPRSNFVVLIGKQGEFTQARDSSEAFRTVLA
jgi:hypothetical protein